MLVIQTSPHLKSHIYWVDFVNFMVLAL